MSEQTENNKEETSTADSLYSEGSDGHAPEKESDSKAEGESEETPEQPDSQEKSESPRDKDAKKESEADNLEYTLEKPEDSSISDELFESIQGIAKTSKLSKEDAEALIDSHERAIEDYNKKVLDEHNAQRDEWVKEIKNDKEFGGEALQETVRLANKAWKHYDDGSLDRELTELGYGDHPAVIRMLARIGRDMESDRFVHGNQSGAQKSAADLLYGN